MDLSSALSPTLTMCSNEVDHVYKLYADKNILELPNLDTSRVSCDLLHRCLGPYVVCKSTLAKALQLLMCYYVVLTVWNG